MKVRGLNAWLLLLFAMPAGSFAQDSAIIDRCYLGAIQDVPLAADDVGKLVELYVDDGANVEAGDVIAQIDDNEAKMALGVAQYQYAAAKMKATNDISIKAAIASNEVAKTEHEDMVQSNLKIVGTYPRTEVRRAKLNWDRSGLQIELARHEMDVARAEAWASHAQLSQAQAMIDRSKLKAPFSGVINQVVREQGEWVNAGDPVVHLVRMDRLRVHGRILSTRFNWNDVQGRPVDVTVELSGGGSHTVKSQIGYASQIIEDDNTFRIWADIDNTLVGDRWLMGPGLSATIRLR